MANDAFSVAGKNVIVTGAAMGIGFGIAKRFVEAGAKVLLVDSNEGALVKAASGLGATAGRVTVAVLDMASPDCGVEMVKRCVEAYGSIDVLVNNAGIYPQVSMLTMTAEAFDRVYQVNLRGLAMASQAAARSMIEKKKGGAIVNIGSIDSLHPSMVGLAAYDASKGGVLMFTKAFALETAPHGIRVNAILPGAIATEGTSVPLASGMTAAQMAAMIEAFTKKIPLHRMGVPDDIANVALFLASSAAAYMTGASVVVDGGVLLS